MIEIDGEGPTILFVHGLGGNIEFVSGTARRARWLSLCPAGSARFGAFTDAGRQIDDGRFRRDDRGSRFE